MHLSLTQVETDCSAAQTLTLKAQFTASVNRAPKLEGKKKLASQTAFFKFAHFMMCEL